MASPEDLVVAPAATPSPDAARKIIVEIRAAAAQRDDITHPNSKELVDQLRAAWPLLEVDVRVDALRVLAPEKADTFFVALPAVERAEMLACMQPANRATWMRKLRPDDAADVLLRTPEAERPALLELLDADVRTEVTALLAYAEDEAGGLMSQRYARLRPQMTVDEAILYLRHQARDVAETIYIAYVLDPDHKLLGVVSLRELFAAEPRDTVADAMTTEVVRVGDHMEREAVVRMFSAHDFAVLPVVDAGGVMTGIVTADDLVGAVVDEATDDIHRQGGMKPLATPYLTTSPVVSIKQRIGWLLLLLAASMLTATALESFAGQLDTVPALALFLPMIIRAGGNSGAQTSALVGRAIALGEVRRADWKRILRRELVTGLALGAVLGVAVLARVALWGSWGRYGDDFMMIAVIAGLAVIGCVAIGAITGAMLPFVLRRIGADPASASAPFVATIVDILGILVYFGIAALMLMGLR